MNKLEPFRLQGSARTLDRLNPRNPNATLHNVPLEFGALRAIVGFHLARASVTSLDAFDRHILKPFGLHKAEFSLLMLLLANEEVTPKPLAKALRITAPKLTMLLDRLQDRGVLERRPNPLDGRSQHVLLTAPGRTLANQACAAAMPMEAELKDKLSAAEHAMLIELLDKLSS